MITLIVMMMMVMMAWFEPKFMPINIKIQSQNFLHLFLDGSFHHHQRFVKNLEERNGKRPLCWISFKTSNEQENHFLSPFHYLSHFHWSNIYMYVALTYFTILTMFHVSFGFLGKSAEKTRNKFGLLSNRGGLGG